MISVTFSSPISPEIAAESQLWLLKSNFGFGVFLFGGIALLQLTSCGEEPQNIQPLTHSWEIAVPNQEIPEGLWSLKAEDCGSCHVDHYKEWRTSTHSHAWTDLQFQAELKKESSPFMCINCHIPLQNQQEYIVTGLIDGDIYQPVKEKNPHFDLELQQEGINCASCHVRDGAVIGPTGSEKAPHKTVKDTEHLSESLCISCHNATAVITPTLACSFETGDEWEAGPYFGKKNCIDCHMDTTHRELVLGYGEKLSHFHSFPGSGIPKFDTVSTSALQGLEIYPADLPKRISLGDSLHYSLTVKNEHAGHKVPTGDPERFFTIEFILFDALGDTVAHQLDRIGEHWQWHPEVKKLSDNNLLPGEERTFAFDRMVPNKGKFELHVTVEKHRLNQESADYNGLDSSYPLKIELFTQKYAFTCR